MADVLVKLDFGQLREIADLGIRRASVFMGIATNVARVDPPISHILDDTTLFVVVPQEISEEQRREFVTEFERWTITNGFREIVESFSVFLSETYCMWHVVETNSVESLAQVKRRFSFRGVSEQLAKVCDVLGLENRFANMFTSMNQARNCLAHRRGIVGAEDGAMPEKPFTFYWRTRTCRLEDGRDVSLALQRGEQLRVEKGQVIRNEEVERSKDFALGQPIHLTRHELSEICFGLHIAIEVVGQGLLAYVRNSGIDIPEAPGEEQTSSSLI